MALRIHHIGVAVRDVGLAAAEYVRCFGYEVKSAIIHDVGQTALVQFLKLPGDVVYLELVSPDSSLSKLARAVERGGGLNHICYVTDDLDSASRELRTRGLFLLEKPCAAVAFPGRRIAWFMGRDGIPIELVEKGPPDEP